MEKSIQAYTEAKNRADLMQAYGWMLEWSDAEEDAVKDDVDAMLDRMGLPSLSDRLASLAA